MTSLKTSKWYVIVRGRLEIEATSQMMAEAKAMDVLQSDPQRFVIAMKENQ